MYCAELRPAEPVCASVTAAFQLQMVQLNTEYSDSATATVLFFLPVQKAN
jgi:hypothetical protein